MLLDFDWLVTKMYELGATQLLIDDYSLMPFPKSSVLASVRQALTQNSRILDHCEEVEELANTLYTRLSQREGLLESVTIRSTSLPRPYILPFHPLPDVPHPAHVRTLAMHFPAVRHESVYDCEISPGGQTVITALQDTTLKLWDIATGAELHTLSGHQEAIRGCAISGDGRIILSASADHTLKAWDAATGAGIGTFEGHSDKVNACAISSDRFCVK